MLDILSQIMIFTCGASAVWLVARLDKWKRYGYILGIIAQPFWFYTTFTHQQYGITILSFWYTYSWGLGIYNYWIKKED